MPTHTEQHPALDQLANIEPGCDVGHPGGPGKGRVDPCTERADFSSTIHACQPDTNATTLWCADHLADAVINIQDFISHTHGNGSCANCDKPFREVADLIWNVAPLRGGKA